MRKERKEYLVNLTNWSKYTIKRVGNIAAFLAKLTRNGQKVKKK